MRIVRVSELRGIAAIVISAIALGVILLALTGKLQKLTGIRLPSLTRGTYGKIVFVSDRSGAPDIWIMDSDGSNQRPLTRDSARDADPAWSPDGKKIIFASDRSGGSMQLFVMRPDGSKLRQITSSSGAKSMPTFSPDGFSIAYLTAGRVFSVDITGGGEKPILPAEEEYQRLKAEDEEMPYRSVFWASDSTRLAAIQEMQGVWSIQVVDEPGAKPHIVTDSNGVPVVGDRVSAAWSKEGLRLAITLTVARKHHLLATWDMENGEFERLFAVSGDPGLDSPDWSPDGDSIALGLTKTDEHGLPQPAGIVLVDLSSQTVTQIEKRPAYGPKWSPDGKSILYVLKKDGRTDIWKYDIEEGKSISLTKGRGNNYSPAWGPIRKK